jgi:hypothetical protein
MKEAVGLEEKVLEASGGSVGGVRDWMERV